MTDYTPDPAHVVTHSDVLLSLAQCCGVDSGDADIMRAEFTNRLQHAQTKQESINVLIAAMHRCIDARHPFSYLSVPLTTGRAYIELRARQASDDSQYNSSMQAARNRTIAANRSRAGEAAERLRTKLTGMLIDPSRFVDVEGWEQSDYHNFWTEVIHRFAEKVFFLDGWQYSVGCTIEFSTAVKLGLPTMTAEPTKLSAATGLQLVHEAVQEYRKIGLDPQPLNAALSVSAQDIKNSHPRPGGSQK